MTGNMIVRPSAGTFQPARAGPGVMTLNLADTNHYSVIVPEEAASVAWVDLRWWVGRRRLELMSPSWGDHIAVRLR